MSQESLIAKIKNDEWFISFIERRLKENKELTDEMEHSMNEIALLSSIDFRLKYLNSKISESSKETIQKIMEICKENGFIPQYESSGAPAFLSGRVELSPDGIFTACFSNDGIVIFPGRELPLCWTKLTLGISSEINSHNIEIFFSPNSSKIAILHATTLHIWDVAELKFQKSVNLNFRTASTINTISWSEDSKRIVYVEKNESEKYEVCVYDIHEDKNVQSIPASSSVSATCLDNQGMNLLLLEDSTIRIIDVTTGNEINTMDSPVPLIDSEALFKDEGFYVLTNGTILKIKDEIEIINSDDFLSPVSQKFVRLYNQGMFDFQPSPSCYGLIFENGNLIIHDTHDECNKVDYILSDTLDVKKIQRCLHDSRFNDKSEISKTDEDEISDFLTQAEKRYISYESVKNADQDGQTVYLVAHGQIIGFEKIEENDRYIKYNFRKYIFSNPLGNLYGLVIPPEFMKPYEQISSENLNGEFRDDMLIQRDLQIRPHSGKKMYFRKTGTDVLIEDSSMFKFCSFSISFNDLLYRYKFQKGINGDKNVYILDDTGISARIGLSNNPGNERLVLSEDGIEIITIPQSNKLIRSDDFLNVYCLDDENVLYCIDLSANAEKIADSKTFQDQSLTKIEWISGSNWPKIYISRNGKNESKTFIQWAPMQDLNLLENIRPSRPQNIRIFSEKIYWVSNEGDICVSELDGSNVQRKKIINFGGWRSTGKSSNQCFSLIKFEVSDNQKTVNVKFARLTPENGHVDVFEKACFDFNSHEWWHTDIDVKNLSVITREWNKICSRTIKKEELKIVKAIIPSVDLTLSNMTSLGNERYVLSTTEDIEDSENTENPEDMEKENPENSTNLWYQPRLRVMDSDDGSKITYKFDQTGQMYGLPGYQIDSKSKAFSIDGGKFIVSEMFSGSKCRISSWEISDGKRYPADKAPPIFGRLLTKVDENTVLVALESDGIVYNVATYNKKMTKISEEKTIFSWDQSSSDSRSKELNPNVLLEKFSCISGLVNENQPEYIEIVKNVVPFQQFKNGTVVILPIRVYSKSEIPPSLPHIYTFDRIFDCYSGNLSNQNPLVWMNIQAIICTYSYGRLIDPIEINLDLVARNDPECKHLPHSALRHLSLYRVGGKYIIQQPIRQNLSDVSDDMMYKTRIIGNEIDFEIENITGWQIKGSDTEKLFSLFIDHDSFSYVTVKGEDVLFVTNKNGKETTKKICNEGEYRPMALYSDKSVSISFDPLKSIMFISKEETTMIPVGNLLDNTYKFGKFDLISKNEDETMYFDIGSGQDGGEIEITSDTKIQKLERKQDITSSDKSNKKNCELELDGGKIVNYNGVFVKYLN
jgi:hypothetical protein